MQAEIDRGTRNISLGSANGGVTRQGETIEIFGQSLALSKLNFAASTLIRAARPGRPLCSHGLLTPRRTG